MWMCCHLTLHFVQLNVGFYTSLLLPMHIKVKSSVFKVKMLLCYKLSYFREVSFKLPTSYSLNAWFVL